MDTVLYDSTAKSVNDQNVIDAIVYNLRFTLLLLILSNLRLHSMQGHCTIIVQSSHRGRMRKLLMLPSLFLFRSYVIASELS